MVPRKYGGVERMFLAVARECTARGHEFHMVSEAPPMSPQFSEDFRDAGGQLVVIPARGRSVGFLWDLARWLDRRRIDVLHSHFGSASLLALVAGRAMRVPLCLRTVHSGLLPEHQRKYPLSSEFMARIRRALTATELYVSKEVMRQYRRLRLASARAEVYYLGVDPQEPDIPPPRIRVELGLGPKDRVILCVAFHGAVKGVDVLLRAMPDVVKSIPGVKLVQVGGSAEAAETETLKALSRALGMEGHVQWLGHRNDVLRLLPCGDVYCQPSRAEGLPLSILEAMNAGLPVVATRVGGIPEAVLHGRTGLLVPPESPADLSSALVRLLEDAPMRRDMGLAGRRYARENFDRKRQTCLLIDSYEEKMAVVGPHASVRLSGSERKDGDEARHVRLPGKRPGCNR